MPAADSDDGNYSRPDADFEEAPTDPGIHWPSVGYWPAHALAYTLLGEPLAFLVDAKHPTPEEEAQAKLEDEPVRINVRLRQPCNINGTEYKAGMWRSWLASHVEWLN